MKEHARNSLSFFERFAETNTNGVERLTLRLVDCQSPARRPTTMSDREQVQRDKVLAYQASCRGIWVLATVLFLSKSIHHECGRMITIPGKGQSEDVKSSTLIGSGKEGEQGD